MQRGASDAGDVGMAGARRSQTAATGKTCGSVEEFGEAGVLAFHGVEEVVVAADAAHGAANQVDAEAGEGGAEDEQGDEPLYDFGEPVGLGGGDEDAEDGEGEGEDGDAGAEGGERGALFGKEELDFVEGDGVEAGGRGDLRGFGHIIADAGFVCGIRLKRSPIGEGTYQWNRVFASLNRRGRRTAAGAPQPPFRRRGRRRHGEGGCSNGLPVGAD